MSGHNKWSQIKTKKGATDKKRGNLFGKLLKAISIAARDEHPPASKGRGSPSSTGRQFNPRLRSAIEKAKENNVPQENIDRAVSKASEEKDLEEVVIEAYGPEGVAIIIEGITDNKNRTTSEIRHILDLQGAKMANPGSVLWSFDKTETGWQPKFKQSVSQDTIDKISQITETLEEHDDVQKITVNI